MRLHTTSVGCAATVQLFQAVGQNGVPSFSVFSSKRLRKIIPIVPCRMGAINRKRVAQIWRFGTAIDPPAGACVSAAACSARAAARSSPARSSPRPSDGKDWEPLFLVLLVLVIGLIVGVPSLPWSSQFSLSLWPTVLALLGLDVVTYYV
jgi:hypothetical protein